MPTDIFFGDPVEVRPAENAIAEQFTTGVATWPAPGSAASNFDIDAIAELTVRRECQARCVSGRALSVQYAAAQGPDGPQSGPIPRGRSRSASIPSMTRPARDLILGHVERTSYVSSEDRSMRNGVLCAARGGLVRRTVYIRGRSVAPAVDGYIGCTIRPHELPPRLLVPQRRLHIPRGTGDSASLSASFADATQVFVAEPPAGRT